MNYINNLTGIIQAWLTTNPYDVIIDIARSFLTMTMNSQFESAANLTSAGAVMAVFTPGHATPTVYTASAGQNLDGGFVQLTKTDHSKALEHKKMQDFKGSKIANKYDALNNLSPAMKAGANARDVQAKGAGRYEHAVAHRASLRAQPYAAPKAVEAKAQPVVQAPTKTISVSQLAMKKPEVAKQESLASRMKYWAQGMGVVPELTPIHA